MKKMIALILALVLILSMSISVSAADLVASVDYYIRVHNRPADTMYVAIYYQPVACNDDVIPEAMTPEYEEFFINRVMADWKCVACTEVKDNVFAGFILDTLSDEDFNGNFILHMYGDPDAEDSFVAVSDVKTFFNGKNGLDVYFDFEKETVNYEYFRDRYSCNGNMMFVYGSRGEAETSGDVISVDLEWGSMEFVYTPEQTLWNPNTHEYEEILNEDGSSNSGWSLAEGSSNHIAITNHSNIPVEAVLEFEPADGKEIHGQFDSAVLHCESAENAYNSPEKAPSDYTEFNIIQCEIDKDTQGDLGTITVTLRQREA